MVLVPTITSSAGTGSIGIGVDEEIGEIGGGPGVSGLGLVGKVLGGE